MIQFDYTVCTSECIYIHIHLASVALLHPSHVPSVVGPPPTLPSSELLEEGGKRTKSGTRCERGVVR
jgi:hypothetical protein